VPEDIDTKEAALAPPFSSLRRRRFALLTTRRKNGEGVATPVWVVLDDTAAYVISRGPGKVRRIANDPDVELAPCTMRGRPRGDAAPGTARIVGSAIPKPIRRLFLRRYGPAAALSLLFMRLVKTKPTLLEIHPRAQAPEVKEPGRTRRKTAASGEQ
jgi:uncharacterized protein